MDKGIRVDWLTIKNLRDYESIYDKKGDILLIQTSEQRPLVSVDCGGEFWMRVDPDTGEIFGVEIEAFKKVFLKKHKKEFRSQVSYIEPVTHVIEVGWCSRPPDNHDLVTA